MSLCTGKDATKTLTEEGFGVSGFWFQRLVSGLNATTFVMKPLRSRWHRIIYLGDMMYTRECCHIDRVYVIAWVSNYHSYNSNVHASMHRCIDARHACRMDWFPCAFNIFCQLYPDSIYSFFFFSGHPKETLQQRPITDFMFLQHFADDLSFTWLERPRRHRRNRSNCGRQVSLQSAMAQRTAPYSAGVSCFPLSFSWYVWFSLSLLLQGHILLSIIS